MKTGELIKLSYMGGPLGTISMTVVFECEESQNLDVAARAARAPSEALLSSICSSLLSVDADAIERRRLMRQEIVGLFGESAVYVEEIPNRYGSSWYYSMSPWFRITTRIGNFIVGWRKRVIHIEWTDTLVNDLSVTVFQDVDVTKFDRCIHAWSYLDAKNYINRIFALAEEQGLTCMK